MNAKIISVIEVETDNGRFYYKIDGLAIGSVLVSKVKPMPEPEDIDLGNGKTQSAIIKQITPAQSKLDKEIKSRKEFSIEDVIKESVKQ